jgi:N-dimethylarginine dimethylaminohydrolase
MVRRIRRRVSIPVTASVAILSALAWAQSSGRAVADEITATSGYSVSIFAQDPPNTSSPDSIALDGNKVYVGYGDRTKSDGSDGLPSTVAEFTTSGS